MSRVDRQTVKHSYRKKSTHIHQQTYRQPFRQTDRLEDKQGSQTDGETLRQKEKAHRNIFTNRRVDNHSNRQTNRLRDKQGRQTGGETLKQTGRKKTHR